jgi:hypothetical protein
MKKLLMVTMITLTSLTSFGQIQKINGFGKLQLGMSVSDIPELSNAKIVETDDEYFDNVYENRSDKVYEARIDTIDLYARFATKSKKERIFQIGQISITNDITLENTTLKFFNDKLYSVEVNDTKLDELLTLKYGKPKERIIEKAHTFQNGFGAKFVKTDIKREHTWNTTNPTTQCYYVSNFWYNDKGELLNTENGYLYDIKVETMVDSENAKLLARIKQREVNSKKRLVTGF